MCQPRRHTIGHILLRISQEAARHNGADAKRDTRDPHPLQTIRIRPSHPDRRRTHDLLRHARHLHDTLWRGQERPHKRLGTCRGESRLDRPFRDIQGKFGRELVDEDVVVDGVADGAADGADGEGEGHAGGDGGVGCHHHGDGGGGHEDAADADAGHGGEGDGEAFGLGGYGGEGAAECR